MPGALAVESFGGENGGEGEAQDGGNMDFDDDDEQIMTRPCTPESAGVDNNGVIAFTSYGFASIQTELVPPNCVWIPPHDISSTKLVWIGLVCYSPESSRLGYGYESCNDGLPGM
jgi:hypothetical protein